MSDSINMSTAELAALLSKKRAEDAYNKRVAERERKIANGEIRATRGREKGSLSLRAMILNNPSAMSALVLLHTSEPENALVSMVYRDVFR